jgi:hypothetical protein
LVHDALGGWLLHPIDLAINKVLALAGRDEPRDFVDTMWVMERLLPLGALVWAAAGKDPGVTPLLLLELLRRRGRYRPEDFTRLQLTAPLDLVSARDTWRAALDDAHAFILRRPSAEIGCLYYDTRAKRFVQPDRDAESAHIVPHFGAPGGVIPRAADASVRAAVDEMP